MSNPGAMVEVVLTNPRSFEANNAKALDAIERHFGKCWHFQRWQPDEMRSETKRFVTNPEKLREFVYITDIDIILLEDIATPHLAHMKKTGLPYSNVLRPGGISLSGLHFTKADAFYPVIPVKDLPLTESLTADETTLCDMVKAKGLALPSPDDVFRPVPGYHLSLNRSPLGGDNQINWSGLDNPAFLASFDAMVQHPCWQEAYPFFDHKFRWLMAVLDPVLTAMHQKTTGRECDPQFRAVFCWDNAEIRNPTFGPARLSQSTYRTLRRWVYHTKLRIWPKRK